MFNLFKKQEHSSDIQVLQEKIQSCSSEFNIDDMRALIAKCTAVYLIERNSAEVEKEALNLDDEVKILKNISEGKKTTPFDSLSKPRQEFILAIKREIIKDIEKQEAFKAIINESMDKKITLIDVFALRGEITYLSSDSLEGKGFRELVLLLIDYYIAKHKIYLINKA